MELGVLMNATLSLLLLLVVCILTWHLWCPTPTVGIMPQEEACGGQATEG